MLQLLHHAASLYHSATHLRHTFTAAHDEMTDITTQPSAVFNQCVETVEWLRTKVPENLQKPRVAVVCGSGLGGIVGCLNTDDGDAGRWEGDYKTVPNFPVSTGRCSPGETDGGCTLASWSEVEVVLTCDFTYSRGPRRQTHLWHHGTTTRPCGPTCRSSPVSPPHTASHALHRRLQSNTSTHLISFRLSSDPSQPVSTKATACPPSPTPPASAASSASRP